MQWDEHDGSLRGWMVRARRNGMGWSIAIEIGRKIPGMGKDHTAIVRMGCTSNMDESKQQECRW